MKQLVIVVMVVGSLLAAVSAHQPAPDGDFVPAGSLAPVDSLPAGPVVVAAYGFVWVALVGYLWFVWRRLQKVERDVAELERRAGVREGGAR